MACILERGMKRADAGGLEAVVVREQDIERALAAERSLGRTFGVGRRMQGCEHAEAAGQCRCIRAQRSHTAIAMSLLMRLPDWTC